MSDEQRELPANTVCGNRAGGRLPRSRSQRSAFVRPPVCLARLHVRAESNQVRYAPKPGHDPADAEVMDPLEFVARAVTQIPQPRTHLVQYVGAYANRARRGPPPSHP